MIFADAQHVRLRTLLIATSLAGLLIPVAPAATFAQEELAFLPAFANRPARVMPLAATVPASAASFVTPEYNVTPGLAQINAATAYALGFTGKGVLVAVVDSGIDPTHSQFAGRLSPLSRNFALDGSAAGDIMDVDDGSHGTHVAGTIAAARDGVGMHGVAFDAQILALRAIVGGPGGDTAAAIAYATEKGAKVLNGSYGPAYAQLFNKDGTRNQDYEALTTQQYRAPDVAAEAAAIRKAGASDMVLIFAASNDRVDQPLISHNPFGAAFYPAIRPENAGKNLYTFFDKAGQEVDSSTLDYSDLQPYTIAVVAVDRDRKIASFSNLCGIAAAWCIAAPGVDVISTVTADKGLTPTQPYNLSSGTSMAAPHVAGTAALVREAFPFLTAPQVVQTILTTATSLGSPEIFGWGLLDAGKAVRGPGQFVQAFDVDTKGYSGTFSNDISGTGGLIKRGEGSLELAGRNTFAGGTSVQGGTLAVNGSVTSGVTIGQSSTLRGTGLVEGGLFSAGTVMPGNSPGTLFVRGPISFGGTSRFVLDIDGVETGNGAGNYSRLVKLDATSVTAGGRIAPTLRGIAGSATNRFTPSIGASFNVLLAEGGLNGSFSGLDQPVDGLPSNARFDALYRSDGLSLIVTPGSYAALAGLGGNAASVARALDVARPAAGTRPDAPGKEVFDALYTAAPGALGTGLASLSGQSYADAGMAGMTAQRAVGSAIDQRLTSGGAGAAGVALTTTDNGFSSLGRSVSLPAAPQDRGSAVTRDGAVWGQGLYGFGSNGGDRSGAGSRFDTAGALFGVERNLPRDGLMGAAVGFLRSNADPRGDATGHASADSYSLTTYGRMDFGNVALRGSLGASYGKTEVRRSIQLGNAQRVGHGERDGYGAFGTLMVGYRLASLGGGDISPEAGISLNHLRQDGLVEKQAGAFGLALRGENLTSARSLVGARWATPLSGNDALRFDLKAYWSHELADNVAVQRASLLGAGFVTRSPEASRDGAVIGASLTGRVAPQFDIVGSYDGDIRWGAVTHRFSLAARSWW